MEDKTFLILSQVKSLTDVEKAKIIGYIALMMNGSFKDAYDRFFNSWRAMPNPNPKNKFHYPYSLEEVKEILRSRVLRKKAKASRKAKGKSRQEKLNRPEMPWQKLNKSLSTKPKATLNIEKKKIDEQKIKEEKAKLDAELDAYTAQRKTFNSTSETYFQIEQREETNEKPEQDTIFKLYVNLEKRVAGPSNSVTQKGKQEEVKPEEDEPLRHTFKYVNQKNIKEVTYCNEGGVMYKIIYYELTNTFEIYSPPHGTPSRFFLYRGKESFQHILMDQYKFNVRTACEIHAMFNLE